MKFEHPVNPPEFFQLDVLNLQPEILRMNLQGYTQRNEYKLAPITKPMTVDKY